MNVVKPMRRKHRGSQTWEATPEKAFPLLCPVRETEWVPGWAPKLVVSNSGFMELGCLFVEPDTPSDATWLVTEFLPNRSVAMYRVVPEVTVSRFAIELTPGEDGTTQAHITYEHTALGPEGEQVVKDFTEAGFGDFMNHFGRAINHYLTTGEKII